jgi:hypothetical protein
MTTVGASCALISSAKAGEPPTSHATQAREFLNEAGVAGGLVVHLGCGDGRLTAALAVSDS